MPKIFNQYIEMKSQYALVLLPVYWFLLPEVSITLKVKPICLTWHTTGSNLTVECRVRVERYTNDIFIVDPFGNYRVQCTLKEQPSCLGIHNHVLHEDISENITTLMLKIEKNNAEGEWKCRHGNEEATTYVSYTEGIIPTIDVEISGEIRKTTNEASVFKLACFSCLKPYNDGVDFYVNNVLDDSIRYHDGLCYHKRKLCTPEKCTCLSRGKGFTWNFITDLSYIQFTCAMRFKDKLKSTISIHQADLLYNGSVFIHKQKSNKSINYADKNPDNTFWNKEQTDNSGYIGYVVLGTIVFIISIILIPCSCKIVKKRKKQAKRKDQKKSEELISLQEHELNDNLPQCNGTPQKERVVLCFRNIFNIILAEKSLDELAIYSNARDHLKQFGLDVLKGWGVEVEKNRVSFHMNKLQTLGRRHHIFLHDVTACLFRGRSFQFLRLYDVVKFELSHLKLHKNMYNELNKIFKMIIDMKGEKWWYHYRRNGLSYKGSSEGAFNLVKQVFLSKKRSAIFKQFSTKESRLSTFQDYPIENKSYREKLAKAGFFYYHVSDYVQCYDCGGCLRAWKSMSDPMVRHKETFKTCRFACHTEWKESSIMDAEPVTYDSLHTQEDRLNSFKSFPDTLSRDDLKRLVKAGFYYCGIAEDIVCSACNIGFASVQNSENILRLHEIHSGKCPNIPKCANPSLRSDDFDQESISNFVPYLELEYRKHDF